MKNLMNKRVRKLTVKDLKEKLKDVDDDTEVVLGFYNLTDGVHFGYLAEVFANMKYDSVLKEQLTDAVVVELACYEHQYSKYLEKNDEL